MKASKCRWLRNTGLSYKIIHELKVNNHLDKDLDEIYKVSLKGFYLTMSALVPVLGHVVRVGLVGVDVVLVLGG